MWATPCFSQLWGLAIQETAIHWQAALGLACLGFLASPWLILLLHPVTFLEHYSFLRFGSAPFLRSIPLLATRFCSSLPLLSLLCLLSLKKAWIITLKCLSPLACLDPVPAQEAGQTLLQLSHPNCHCSLTRSPLISVIQACVPVFFRRVHPWPESILISSLQDIPLYNCSNYV